MPLKKNNLIADNLKVMTFFSECIKPTDCPAGGTNYVCNANKCECPNPMVLDYNKCVGKLQFETENCDCINYSFELCRGEKI